MFSSLFNSKLVMHGVVLNSIDYRLMTMASFMLFDDSCKYKILTRIYHIGPTSGRL